MKVFAIAATALFTLGAAWSQDTSTPQTQGIGRVEHTTIQAGQRFILTVTLSGDAPSFETSATIYYALKGVSPFSGEAQLKSFACNGSTTPGQKEIPLRCFIPSDNSGGLYVAHPVLFLGPPPDASRGRDFKFSSPDIEVSPKEDVNTYPSAGRGSISLNQQQALYDGSKSVERLIDQLCQRLFLDHPNPCNVSAFTPTSRSW